MHPAFSINEVHRMRLGALPLIESVIRFCNEAGPGNDHPPYPGSVRYPRGHPEHEGSRAAAGEENASDDG